MADLAHGGSRVEDPAVTRKSIVGHYCPDRMEHFYFRLRPDRRGKGALRGNLYASQHYEVTG